MSKIMQAALDPSCLLCLTPGGWWSPLRQGVVWPGSPRNFATEPATWDALVKALAGCGTDDLSFEYEYFLDGSQGGKAIVHGTAFNGYLNSVGSSIAHSTSFVAPPLFYDGVPTFSAWTAVKYARQGGVAYLYINDALVASRTGVANVDIASLAASSSSNLAGFIRGIQVVNLSTEIQVFSYPSESERLRLITNTNVLNTGTHWEAADMSKRWSVTTQLRAVSLLPECTIIVEVDNPDGELTTFVSCAQRANPAQGFFVIRKINSTSVMFGYSGKNNSGITSYLTRHIACQSGKHVFTFVLDYSVLQLRIYIDGAEVDNRAMDTGLVAPPEFDGTEKPVVLGATSSSDGFNLTSKISHCLIFDRALSAAEIAALMPKQA